MKIRQISIELLDISVNQMWLSCRRPWNWGQFTLGHVLIVFSPYIRNQRPQKPPSHSFERFRTKLERYVLEADVSTRAHGLPGAFRFILNLIFVISDPKNPQVLNLRRFYALFAHILRIIKYTCIQIDGFSTFPEKRLKKLNFGLRESCRENFYLQLLRSKFFHKIKRIKVIYYFSLNIYIYIYW